MLSFSTADYEGEIQLSDINNPIEITFDQKGIPQIWAANNNDMYFALGWVHASERLFQMELIRRFSAGELSEIFGKVAYPIDLLQRKIGFVRKAQQDFDGLEPEALDLLQSYCAGINAWIDYKNILPPEFVIMRLSPREWKPIDCLTIGLYQTWYAHSLMDKEAQYNRLIERFGDDIKPLLTNFKDWSPPTVSASLSKAFLSPYLIPSGMALASNSWVVSPKRSVSGMAIHASDPHLVINQIPGFWYIVGLHSAEGINALGATAPGLPFMAMGHTDSIAYAFTVASVDVIDYYIEKRNPEDSLQVMTPNGYADLDVIKEEIKVKDQDQPAIEKIYRTPIGVAVESDAQKIVSMKWAGFDFNAAEILNSAFRLLSVTNFEDFQSTVTSFGALDVNWTYSDINGNIGYQLGTPIPRRDHVSSFGYLKGENPRHQWKGYYPLDQTPFAFNPEKGWLATCNNQIVSDFWPYKIPGFYDPYRIVRISELLRQDSTFSRRDMSKIQLDLVSIAARRWKGLMQDGAEYRQLDTLAQRIEEWNGVMFKHGKIPAIFALWWEFLSRPLFFDDLGANWRLGEIIQEEVLTDSIGNIINNLDTPAIQESIEEISAIALDSALSIVDNRKYEDISTLNLVHPLSQVEQLDYWLDLNRGPFTMGGDFSCLNANFNVYEPQEKQFKTVVGPSMRFVLDWAEIDSFSIILNLGQSGNPFSPHYDDFFDVWYNGETWMVPFSKEKVFENRKSLLKLVPKG